MPQKGLAFLNDILNVNPVVSLITKIEILGFPKAEKEETELFAAFIEGTSVLGIPDMVVEHTILIRQAFRIKIPDAIIAATALCYRLKLVTRNTSDFKQIKGLTLVNPHTL